MTSTLRTIALAAGLALTPAALAQGQATSSNQTHQISTNEHSASLQIKDGVATLIVNGERVELPDPDGDWKTYEVKGDDGEVICVVTRPDGKNSYTLRMTGFDMGDLPLPPAAPRALRGFNVVAPEAPGLGSNFAIVTEQPRVMLGVRLDSNPDVNLGNLGLDASKATRINFLMEDLPAVKSGLKVGDIIVGIGDRKSGTIEDIRGALGEREPGDTIAVRVVRDGEMIVKRVKLDSFDEQRMVPVIGDLPIIAEELRAKSDQLDAEIRELTAAVAATKERIAGSTNPEELRELADKMRELAERTAVLNRQRAEVAAQRAARLAQQAELELEQRILREFEEGDMPRRYAELLRRDEDGNLGGGGRLFLEREGQGGPIIIERDFNFPGARGGFNFEGDVERLLEELFEGRMGDLDIQRFIEQGEEMTERVEDELEIVIEEVEERFADMEEDFDDRLSEVEDRLERIESLLMRLIEER